MSDEFGEDIKRQLEQVDIPLPDLPYVIQRGRILRRRQRVGLVSIFSVLVLGAAGALTIGPLRSENSNVTLPVTSGKGEVTQEPSELPFYPAPEFLESQGWNTTSTGSVSTNTTDIPTAWAATVPFLEEESQAGVPRNTLSALPENGVVIVASLPDPDTFPVPPDNPNYQGKPPFRLSAAQLMTTWEGQPRPDIPQLLILGTAKDQFVDLRIYFGTQNPPNSLLRSADQELSRLVIPSRN